MAVDARGFQLSADPAGSLAAGIETGQQLRSQFMKGQEQESQIQRQNQFRQLSAIVADPNRTPQERQAAQQQMMGVAPEQAQKQQKQTIANLSERQKEILTSVANDFAVYSGLPSIEAKINAAKNNRARNIADKKPNDETDEYIAVLESGDVDEIKRLESGIIQAGQMMGTLKPIEDLGIKRETLDLRREELDARNLERLLKEETNVLRREEMGLNIDQKRTKIRQTKIKVRADATAKIKQQGMLSTAIDDFIKNDDYLDSVSGVRGRTPAVTTTGVEAEAFFDNIKNNLTLENLDKMTGVLSETDIKILSTAATALVKGMGRESMTKELKKIQSVLGDKSADVQAQLLGAQPEAQAQQPQQPAAAPQAAPQPTGLENLSFEQLVQMRQQAGGQ